VISDHFLSELGHSTLAALNIPDAIFGQASERTLISIHPLAAR
jgi:hypothetical protein